MTNTCRAASDTPPKTTLRSSLLLGVGMILFGLVLFLVFFGLVPWALFSFLPLWAAVGLNILSSGIILSSVVRSAKKNNYLTRKDIIRLTDIQ